MRRTVFPLALLLAACATSPAQAPPAPPPGDNGGAALLQLESEWREAYRLGNSEAVARIEDEGFVRSSDSGESLSRADDLGELAAHSVEYRVYENREQAVQLAGGSATVTGVCVMEGTAGDKPFRRVLRFSDSFAWRNGAWRATAEQLARLEPMR
jgi:hypothetical protein